MVRTSQNKLAIAQLVEQISTTGQLTRQEHLQLSSALLSDYKLTEEERRQINRIFDSLQIGRYKIVEESYP